MKRQEIIQLLIDKNQYKSYLEIGVASPDSTFNQIKIKNKTSVDPRKDYEYTYNLTSDEFFSINTNKFDIVFIDGLHERTQVYKDINNSLAILNESGTIVCHDMSPPNEMCQIVPQQVGEWCGDCWKAWVQLRMFSSNLEMYVIDTDYGVGIIKRGIQKTLPLITDFTWKEFEINRKKWLNLISVKEFEDIIQC